MLSRNHLEINLRYFCPITQQVMVDPVFTSDGYTYEREAISIWLQANNISPMTGLVLEGKKLTPNLDKRSEIQEWLIDNPAAYQRGVVYLPQDWILHIANELRHWNINTNLPNLLKYLDKDDRLLTIPLWQDYTLIHLAAEFTSLEFTELILNKLIFTNHPICFNSPANFKPKHYMTLLEKLVNNSLENKNELLLLVRFVLNCKYEADNIRNLHLLDYPHIVDWLKEAGINIIASNVNSVKRNSATFHLNELGKFSPEDKECPVRACAKNTFPIIQYNYSVNINQAHHRDLIGHSSSILCLKLMMSGMLASSAEDGVIKIFDPNSGSCLYTLLGHTGAVWGLEQTIDKTLYSCSADQSIKAWDINNKCKNTLLGHTSSVSCIKILENGKLASADANGIIKIWDLTTNTCIDSFIAHANNRIYGLLQLASGELVSCGDDAKIKIWNLVTAKHKCFTGHSGGVWCIQILRDNKLASGSWDGSINIWDLNTNQLINSLQGHTAAICCLAELPNGALTSGSIDHEIRAWDVLRGKCINKLSYHNGRVCSLAVLPGGFFASSSDDKSIKISSTYQLIERANQDLINTLESTQRETFNI